MSANKKYRESGWRLGKALLSRISKRRFTAFAKVAELNEYQGETRKVAQLRKEMNKP